jgi:HSP20 family protein
MDLVHWGNGSVDPFQEFEALQGEINKLFEGFRDAEPAPRGLFERTFSPAVDVVETEGTFEVLCDLPGLDLKDIETTLSQNVLTIKGERRALPETRAGSALSTEVRGGQFQRTIQLPLAVDPEKTEAVLKDGVLRIVLPKHEELKPRQVTVKAR